MTKFCDSANSTTTATAAAIMRLVSCREPPVGLPFAWPEIKMWHCSTAAAFYCLSYYSDCYEYYYYYYDCYCYDLLMLSNYSYWQLQPPLKMMVIKRFSFFGRMKISCYVLSRHCWLEP